jgi:hypothetical protein
MRGTARKHWKRPTQVLPFWYGCQRRAPLEPRRLQAALKVVEVVAERGQDARRRRPALPVVAAEQAVEQLRERGVAKDRAH